MTPPALSGIKTLPLLRGRLDLPGPWRTLLSEPDNRVYPFDLGCTVRTATSGAATNIKTHGMGEFVANDYVLPCGLSGSLPLYIPDISRLTRVTTIGTTEDELNVTPAIVANQDEFLFNLKADGSSVPLTAPNFDGSTIVLFDDPVGTTAISLDYILTSAEGEFKAWAATGTIAADLLITDSSGVVRLVWPFVPLGPEIV